MVELPSFAKINLGLKIGPRRPDGFHELRTVYQTLALQDVLRVQVQPGSGIEIRCSDARVPLDETNTCWKIAERVLAAVREDSARWGEPQIPRLRPSGSARDDKLEKDGHGTAKAVPLQRGNRRYGRAEAVTFQSGEPGSATPDGKSEALQGLACDNSNESGSPARDDNDEALQGSTRDGKRMSQGSTRGHESTALRGSARDGELTETAGEARLRASFAKVVIEIEKRLPVQGGLGAASSNAVATMLGLERALSIELGQADRLRIAAEVGSDLPLFLVGGTVLGVGRGEQVYPLPDLPRLHVVVVTPAVGVSTPRAFAHWDELGLASEANERRLTADGFARTINEFSQNLFDGLAQRIQQAERGPASGVPAGGGDRAETPLLDLVRTGIENDFERVVFPEHPELREVKELLVREGAQYASLSGSGSTLYGLFASEPEARSAAKRMRAAGHSAIATTSLTREEYWKQLEAIAE